MNRYNSLFTFFAISCSLFHAAAAPEIAIRCQSSIISTNTVALSALFMNNIDRLVPVTSNAYANANAALGHLPRDQSLYSGVYYDDRTNELIVFAKSNDIGRSVQYVNTLSAYLIPEIQKTAGVFCYINHSARPNPFPDSRYAFPGFPGPRSAADGTDGALDKLGVADSSRDNQQNSVTNSVQKSNGQKPPNEALHSSPKP